MSLTNISFLLVVAVVVVKGVAAVAVVDGGERYYR
jgi:hypothetical protein